MDDVLHGVQAVITVHRSNLVAALTTAIEEQTRRDATSIGSILGFTSAYVGGLIELKEAVLRGEEIRFFPEQG